MTNNQLWDCLLLLRKRVAVSASGGLHCVLAYVEQAEVQVTSLTDTQNVIIQINTAELHDTWLMLDQQLKIHVSDNTPMDNNQIQFLQTYLPYCFLSRYARTLGRAAVVSHFAQTLDGKIATHKHDSKWIGNDENLIHAHRMRALCDAILIGAKTLEHDSPSLTVRHVKGEHPQRVVLCSSDVNFDSLFRGSNDKVIVFGTSRQRNYPNIEYVQLHSENGMIQPTDILQHLYNIGIYSIYLEGGAHTASLFLQNACIDILQLHISPLLFGSGVAAFSLLPIDAVQQAIGFDYFSFYSIGNTCMFVGKIKNI